MLTTGCGQQIQSDDTPEYFVDGLKTYLNEEYKFELKYPAHLVVEKENPQLLSVGLPENTGGMENITVQVVEKRLDGTEYVDPPSGIHLKYSEKDDVWMPPYLDDAELECLKNGNNQKSAFSFFVEKAFAGSFECEYFLDHLGIKTYRTAQNIKSFVAFGGDGAGSYSTAYIENPNGKFFLKIHLTINYSGMDGAIMDSEVIYSVLDSVEFN